MDLPASGDFDVGNITDNDEAAGLFEAVRTVVEEMPGGHDAEAIALAADIITPTVAQVVVDTQVAATPDDLKRAVYTNHPEGRWLLIRSTDAANVVTVKHLGGGGDGQFYLLDQKDLVLDDPDEFVLFVREGTQWKEFHRSHANRLNRVKTVTAGVGAPLVLVPSDSGRRLENTGAGAAVYATLPAAVKGMNLFLYVAAAQTWNLNPDGADTFRDLATTGTTFSLAAVVGNYVEVECLVAGVWTVVRKQGTLTIT